MKQITTLAAVVLLLGASFGQNKTRDQSTFTFTVSGVTQIMVDGVGTQYNQWEVVPAGSPASLTVTIAGCIRGGTCSATLATSSGTSAQILNTTGVYDYYNVTASWTGGTRVAVTVNRTATLALSGGGGVGSSAFASLTSGTNNTASMVVGTGGAIGTSGVGQIASSAEWTQNGPGVISPNSPTLSQSATGGTISTGQIVYVKVTYVGPATIEPSGEVKLTAAGCTGGNQCSVTVTMPTSCTAGNLPSGVTGCTVWDIIATSGTEKQQAVSPNCVNITAATCVIATIAAGSTLVTPTTTGIVPVGAQTNTCPDNIIPTNWYQGADSNYYPLAGIDISALNGKTSPPGVFTFCNSLFVNDTSGPPVISNALVSIHHQAGNTVTNGSTFDDRAFGIEMIDSGTATPTFEQSLTQYNERIVSNNNFQCNPIGSQAGESCAAAGRFVSSDTRSAPVNQMSHLEGVAGVAGLNSAAAGTNFGSCVGACVIGVRGEGFEQISSANGGAAFFAGVQGEINGSASNTNGSGASFYAVVPSVRFATTNRGYYSQSFGTNATDWDLFLEGTAGTPANGQNFMRGQLYLPKILSNSGAGLAIVGSPNATGSYQTTKLGTAPQPGTISNLGTPGAVTYTYAVVCKDGMGNTSNGGSVRSTTTGNATLDGTNKNQFQVIIPYAAVGCDVYRTASGGTPSSTGKIGTIQPNDPQGQQASGTVFVDSGLAGDNTVMPAVDTTGGASFAGYVGMAMNSANVTADVTFSTDTALHNITGLSWNLGVLAGTYTFECTIIYSQATAAVANAFGIQATLVAPTNIEADGIVMTNTTAVTQGVLATLASTTATNIVSFTPGATATNFIAKLHGQIVEPANTGGNTVNIMALTGAAADALTIRKGSSCQLN